jgi:hypothetical protein
MAWIKKPSRLFDNGSSLPGRRTANPCRYGWKYWSTSVFDKFFSNPKRPPASGGLFYSGAFL